MSFISDFFTSVADIFDHISDIFDAVQDVFTGINFTVLYNWLPSDIATVITACIVVLIFISLIGIVKKIVFFFG